MANKPLRPCRHAGCMELVINGYCERHRPKGERGAESASWHWLYETDQWRLDLRPNQLLREPFCSACSRRHLRTTATEVDHVVPHTGDRMLFADRNNLQSLCKACHSRKTMLEILAKRHEKTVR